MEHTEALAWRGEEALLSPHVRSNPRLVDELLAEDFSEIGQSGQRWSRAETVAALPAELGAPQAVTLEDRRALPLAPDFVLLSYRLVVGDRHSLRSSIWRRTGETVRCVFHQGTPARR